MKHVSLFEDNSVSYQIDNYLFDPSHSEFSVVKIIKSEPFIFEERLFV